MDLNYTGYNRFFNVCCTIQVAKQKFRCGQDSDDIVEWFRWLTDSWMTIPAATNFTEWLVWGDWPLQWFQNCFCFLWGVFLPLFRINQTFIIFSSWQWSRDCSGGIHIVFFSHLFHPFNPLRTEVNFCHQNQNGQKILAPVILQLYRNLITLVLIWKVLRQAFRWYHYFWNPSNKSFQFRVNYITFWNFLKIPSVFKGLSRPTIEHGCRLF
jgi:hypothetical protein